MGGMLLKNARRCTLPFLALLLMLGGLGACQGNKHPPLRLSLSSVDSADTMLYVIYDGLDSVWRDSLALRSEAPLELHPDTARLRGLFLCHDAYRRVYRYELRAGKWTLVPRLEPCLELDSLDSTSVYHLGGSDVRGKYRDMYELLRKGRVAVIFSSLEMKTHSRSERDSLLAHYPKDSLELVYLMLSSSDSAALGRLKRDSLDKKASAVFSDSLALVSRMRLVYGISRDPSPRVFIVDSLGRITDYPPKP